MSKDGYPFELGQTVIVMTRSSNYRGNPHIPQYEGEVTARGYHCVRIRRRHQGWFGRVSYSEEWYNLHDSCNHLTRTYDA